MCVTVSLSGVTMWNLAVSLLYQGVKYDTCTLVFLHPLAAFEAQVLRARIIVATITFDLFTLVLVLQTT